MFPTGSDSKVSVKGSWVMVHESVCATTAAGHKYNSIMKAIIVFFMPTKYYST
jgi:hypothetical protein